ncbi:MAG: hydantoinase B/oxoprolinase family protein, partial [Candidatus Aminicenantes bacterium]|nr:hydantoinase B/oxoprolinase family protein [Candidatus Aminicenantes bacterium]
MSTRDAKGKTDPITLAIMQHALASAADQMALSLYRTAYSTIVRDCLDFSTSLCDAEGEMIAQGVTLPHHIASVPFAMRTLLDKYGRDIDPGDVFILNDPFDGGMHIPDIFVVRPIFRKDRRVGFAVSTAHHADLGGRLPGSAACDNTEIFQEGLRIPWLKLYRRGRPDEAIFALLASNVRIPEMTLGDLRAQLSATHIGANAVLKLIERYGPETFQGCCRDLLAYTERLVRSEIASWPDGSSSFTDHMDSDGVGGPPVRLQVTLTVSGDTLTADFSGTDPQVPGGINCTLSFTTSVVAVC